MNNKLIEHFIKKPKGNLSIFYTAGLPSINDTVTILESLAQAGVDFVEIGFPFSDPLADGPVIKASSQQSLQNGMSLALLFEQLSTVNSRLPIVLMGYWNPVMQYGISQFVEDCVRFGIDAVIIPDLPFDVYVKEYKSLFEQNNISFVPLIAPTTSNERIQYIDAQCKGFIYMVSTLSTTGGMINIQAQEDYFKRVRALPLKNPVIVGFGIQSKSDLTYTGLYANGAIIGSHFVKQITVDASSTAIQKYISQLK